MSDQRHGPESDLDALDGQDAAFVRRIEESYRPAELSPARRVAFHTRLDARIQRRPTRGLWAAAAASVAIALTLVVLRASEGPLAPDVAPPSAIARGDAGANPGDDVMLIALAMSEDGDEEGADGLPEDYVAIADLFLEGV